MLQGVVDFHIGHISNDPGANLGGGLSILRTMVEVQSGELGPCVPSPSPTRCHAIDNEEES